MDKAIAFYTILYNETYLNIIIDKWIHNTSYRFSNIVDFLTFWFDAWAKYAPLDFALNWNHESCGSICFFDIQHKKPNPKKKKTKEDILQFEEKNLVLKDLQETFCIPYTMIQSNPETHKELTTKFSDLIKYDLFAQNKLRGKHIICFYKFKYNYLCKLDTLIGLVFKRLRFVYIQNRPQEEYILFEEFVYNYRTKIPYFDGLLIANKMV